MEWASQADPVLGQVNKFNRQGWPGQVSNSSKPFWHWCLELTIEGGHVLWGIRAVVPQKFQKDALKMLQRLCACALTVQARVIWSCTILSECSLIGVVDSL